MDISSSFSPESMASYSASSATSESIRYPPPEEGFLNDDLLALIRAENSSLKAMRNLKLFAL